MPTLEDSLSGLFANLTTLQTTVSSLSNSLVTFRDSMEELEDILANYVLSYSLSDSNGTANSISDNVAANTAITGVTWNTNVSGTKTWSLLEDADGRFTINSSVGTLLSAIANIYPPGGPRSLAFLPFDLYAGGDCPVVPSQTGEYYVDVENGSQANDGLSTSTPWKYLSGKTVSNAVIYIMGSGTVDIGSYSGVFAGSSGGLTNVTIRPLGDERVTIKNSTYVANNACFWLDSSASNDDNVTIWNIGVEGWYTGFLVQNNVDVVRILKCHVKDVIPNAEGPDTQAHHLYFGYSSGGLGPRNVEIAYCTGEHNHANKIGAWLQCYGGPNGLTDAAIHHNAVVDQGQYHWGWIQSDNNPSNIHFFNNTFDIYADNAIIEFGNYDSGSGADSSVKLYNNILVQRKADLVVWENTAGTHAPDWTGTNTFYRTDNGSTVFGSSITEGEIGNKRDPQLTAGVAGNALEQGSGRALADTPVHIGINGKANSVNTYADRGAYAYGQTPASEDAYSLTVQVTNGTDTASAQIDITITT